MLDLRTQPRAAAVGPEHGDLLDGRGQRQQRLGLPASGAVEQHDDALLGGAQRQRLVARAVATETGVLKLRAAVGSGSRSEARQCEFA